MIPVYCQFSDGINDGLAAERFAERVAFFVLALLAPNVYRMGRANGRACIWWKRTTPSRENERE